jgi:hypothetical protein
LDLCHLLGLTPLMPYNLAGRPPWGVPAFLSLTFWGGVCAIPIGLILDRIPRGWPYWVGAALLGSLPPTLTSFLWPYVAMTVEHNDTIQRRRRSAGGKHQVGDLE